MEEFHHNTALLRKDSNQLWVTLRSELLKHHYNPDSCFVAFSVEEGDAQEFGIVVTDKKTVIQYSLDFSKESDASYSLSDWNDITETFEGGPYKPSIDLILQHLNRK